MALPLFSPQGIFEKPGLSLLRMVLGLALVYHGLEFLNFSQMREYAGWPSIKTLPFPLAATYGGKIMELAGGLLLGLGLWTRVGVCLVVLPMLFIIFFIGAGKIWYEDQYPFLFILLSMVFFFQGPGIWSLDNYLFSNKNASHAS